MQPNRRTTFWIVPFLALAGLAAAGRDVRLLEAVKEGDAKGVRTLLQQKVAVDASEADGSTALHWAVYGNDAPTVDLLIQAGADVKHANRYGVTALSLAAESRRRSECVASGR
jgi:ankyrin repeat protein